MDGAAADVTADQRAALLLTDPSSEGQPSGAPSIEFIERLYRSTNSYADRLTSEELGWVDVDLGLDDHMQQLALTGHQIVVTGNPGDGKTHLIERLRPALEEAGALVLTDANVLSDEEILRFWRACDDKGRTMVLAINEWPLFVLRRHELAVGFTPLTEALRQVQQAVSFGNRPVDPAGGRVRIIDLSLRNLLCEPVVRRVIDRLTDDRFYTGLSRDDPAVRNRERMRDPQVQARISQLLNAVARRGHHATMRQLVGFIAFMITGGAGTTARLAAQGWQDFHYAHLAFEGGIGPLFDAVRTSFDPAAVTHPRQDMHLWQGTTSRNDWVGEDSPAGVQHIHSADRLKLYRVLKRRFFFEHRAGDELLGFVPVDERRFDELVTGGQEGRSTVVRDLLLAINRFYEPNCPDTDKDRLVLWQSHRFDVRAPDTFLRLHEVSHRQFGISPRQLAAWVTEWLPVDQQIVRNFALAARDEHGEISATLLVDRSLYLTLAEAYWGLGRTSWSRSATRRVTQFVDQVHNSLPAGSSDVEVVRIRNVERDLDATFEIQRNPAVYRL